MTADLAVINTEVLTTSAKIKDLVRHIRETDDAAYVESTRKHVKVAREWAKLHDTAQVLERELMRLEIICLQQLAKLDALDLLPANTSARTTARYFVKLDEAVINEAILRYNATTALGLMRWMTGEAQRKQETEQGREFANHPQYQPGDYAAPVDPREEHRYYREDVRVAAIALIDALAVDGRTFTVSDMADRLIEELGLDWVDPNSGLNAPFREGVMQVCRSVVRSAPSLLLGQHELPRFVTAFESSSGEYIRVPTENATLRQLSDMIGLRSEQMIEDKAALDKLRVGYDLLAEQSTKDDERIGDILTRAGE